MINLVIDGKLCETKAGNTVLQAALENDILIPYFCYHPGLTLSGNCRMCLVEIEKSNKLLPSCVTPAVQGMIVKTKTEKVTTFRKDLLELLLLNHPVDCPICDKAGECMLQDNYFNYSGRKYSSLERKNLKPKLQYFSERIVYDAERCIMCSRCIRFTEEISKTFSLGTKSRGSDSEITTIDTFSDIYSDNVIDICPVGALKSRYFRFDSRTWYLTKVASTCPLCARGCQIELNIRDNRLRRVLPNYTEEINGYWMCNYGRDLNTYLDRERNISCTVNAHPENLEECLKVFQRWIGETETSKIVLIASSFGSNEEIIKFDELAQKVFRTPFVFRKEDRHSSENFKTRDKMSCSKDDILIKEDKNPNSAGLTKFLKDSLDISALKEILENNKIEMLIIWGEGFSRIIGELKINGLIDKIKHKIVISPFTNEFYDSCELIIPSRTFIEKDGEFTNFNGVITRFNKAIIPPEETFDDLYIFNQLEALIRG